MNYSFKQILERVNAELDESKKWEPSKLRYYLLNVLKEPPQQRGKESSYPELTLNKVILISKLMESRLRPSTKQIKAVLRDVTVDELARIANGTEPLEIGVPYYDESGAETYKTLSGNIYSRNSPDFGRVLQIPLEARSSSKMQADSASNYLHDLMNEEASFASAAKTRSPWQTLRLGPDLEIRHKMKLTKSQKKQLKLTGQLLRLMLGKEK